MLLVSGPLFLLLWPEVRKCSTAVVNLSQLFVIFSLVETTVVIHAMSNRPTRRI